MDSLRRRVAVELGVSSVAARQIPCSTARIAGPAPPQLALATNPPPWFFLGRREEGERGSTGAPPEVGKRRSGRSARERR
jgi:hypothetical protein